MNHKHNVYTIVAVNYILECIVECPTKCRLLIHHSMAKLDKKGVELPVLMTLLVRRYLQNIVKLHEKGYINNQQVQEQTGRI